MWQHPVPPPLTANCQNWTPEPLTLLQYPKIRMKPFKGPVPSLCCWEICDASLQSPPSQHWPNKLDFLELYVISSCLWLIKLWQHSSTYFYFSGGIELQINEISSMNMIKVFISRVWINKSYWSQESKGNLRLSGQLSYSNG